ncbi:hypothetical protein [Microcoleus vaginatus]|uniref:hypothetical protein n=1 Tax=Microcoleus vaginatus TaxID=119532 RepID=UPI0016872797|nr:hypothetical protein [Microcoleus sp. FACHB-DQ6]MBD1883579.1 hypothetical protein [Microcoleus sp. FACHB-84]
MPQPPAKSDPPDPAPTPRRLTNRASETRIPPTVRSGAGRLSHFDRQIQQHTDSIKRTANSLGARQKSSNCIAASEIFYGG